jgi:hypothetical protein
MSLAGLYAQCDCRVISLCSPDAVLLDIHLLCNSHEEEQFNFISNMRNWQLLRHTQT